MPRIQLRDQTVGHICGDIVMHEQDASIHSHTVQCGSHEGQSQKTSLDIAALLQACKEKPRREDSGSLQVTGAMPNSLGI